MMRSLVLTLGITAGSLLIASAAEAERPSPEGAWTACQSWVKAQLYQPAGLRFPQLGTDQVALAVSGDPRGPKYLVRSVAILPGQEGEERLVFSCTVQHRITTDGVRAFVYRRLVLPDSTAQVPHTQGGVFTAVTTRGS